jgi:hypothetical protein
MAEYRKRAKGTWHWYKNCSRWKAGKGPYTSKRGATKPTGDKCNECKAKEKKGTGRPF